MICQKCGKEFEGNFCPECGWKEKNKKPKSLKSEFKFWIIVVLILSLSVGAVAGALRYTHQTPIEVLSYILPKKFSADLSQGKMTAEKYNQISTGMTKNEVIQIVGSNGSTISSVSMYGTKMETVDWYGVGDSGTNADVMFENDKVTGKAQVGIE